MASSTPMDVDPPTSNGSTALNITRQLGNSTVELSQVISSFKSVKLFPRESKDDTQPRILSLDFDDPGELCLTSESDETIQIYKVKEGQHEKSLASKKYGAKLATFTHHSSSIIYASTKQNDAIRYLATHDNSFIRYFEGHEDPVTSISMHPGKDNFISCSKDNTVRIWDVQSRNYQGLLYLNNPYLSAWDPAGLVFAVGSPPGGAILLYDHRKFDNGPIGEVDVVQQGQDFGPDNLMSGWTKIEFSNDGKWILLGTNGDGHFLFDAFDYTLKAYLRKPSGGTRRAAPGEGSSASEDDASSSSSFESSGDCCFSPDARFVLSGTKKNVLVWNIAGSVGDDKTMDPTHVLEDNNESAVVAFNPRFNFFASADEKLMFWLPDPQP